jgi:hypothetical protein
MKYMLLIYDNEQAWAKLDEAERREIYGAYMQFSESIKASRNYLAGSQLHATATASSVSVRDDNLGLRSDWGERTRSIRHTEIPRRTRRVTDTLYHLSATLSLMLSFTASLSAAVLAPVLP